MMKAADLFPGPDADAKVKAAKEWLVERGIKDLDPVPLATETLEKVLLLLFNVVN
jgi:5'-3' exoribonuclease 1